MDPAAVRKLLSRYVHYQWAARRAQELPAHALCSCLAVFSLLLLLSAVLLKGGYHAEPEPRYQVLIDAGSTGTRIHVLRCAARLGLHPAAPPSIEMLWPHLHQAPGLSAYGNPADAAASLRPLLEFAYRAVPEALHARTPVHLLATAGLRLLPPEAATAILDACSAELASSRLLFRRQWAAIINGSTEGIYSFIAVNYARGALQGAVAASGAPSAGPAHNIKGLQPQGPQGPQLVGVLELGGASLQVTFLPEGPQHPSGSSGGEQQAEGLRELQAELELLGIPGPLFSRSYLGIGLDTAQAAAAQLLLQEAQAAGRSEVATGAAAAEGGAQQQQQQPAVLDPCMPNGYRSQDGRVGTGSFHACLLLASRLLRTLLLPQLGIDGGTAAAEVAPSAANARLMQLPGSFLGIENFFWIPQALGLPEDASLEQLAEAGQRHCGMSEAQLRERAQGEATLTRWCFGAAFAHALLHEGFGVGLTERRIRFANSAVLDEAGGQHIEFEWALGAALVLLSQRAQQRSSPPSEHIDGMRVQAGDSGWARYWALGSTPGAAALLRLLALTLLLLAAGWAACVWLRRRRRAAGCGAAFSLTPKPALRAAAMGASASISTAAPHGSSSKKSL